jgi:hypothetical protein
MPPPKTKPIDISLFSDRQLELLFKQLSEKGYNISAPPKKKKDNKTPPKVKSSKKEVPIIFEESPKSGVRLDKLDDLFPKKKKDNKTPPKVKSSKKSSKKEVPIIFEESPKKKNKKDKTPPKVKSSKKEKKESSPTKVLSRSEKMRLNIQERRELLDRAIDLGYTPKNKRVPGKSVLEEYTVVAGRESF